MFNGILLDEIKLVLDAVKNTTQVITNTITKSPQDVFGNTFWGDLINQIGMKAVMPFALTLFCYAMAAELYKVYCQNPDGIELSALTTSCVKFVIPFMILTKTYTAMEYIFQVFNGLVYKISEQTITAVQYPAMDIKSISDKISSLNFIEQLFYASRIWFLPFTVNIMQLVIMVIVYGRLFEMVMYWIIAPIPLASLISGEYSQIGKNFFKMFAAILLQGAFMLLCVAMYGLLIKKLVFDPKSLIDLLDRSIWMLFACEAVLIFALAKTGTIAKRVLGTF